MDLTPKAVLFDLDGCLIDACDWHKEAFNKALMSIAKFELSEEEHSNIFNGLPSKRKVELLLKQGKIKEYQIGAILNLKVEFTNEIINKKCKIDESKIELLRFLKNIDVKLACVTNSIRHSTISMLSKIGIYDFIDLIITNEDVRFNKPSPEPYIDAMVMLNSRPRTTLIVEDSEVGLQAARATTAKIWQVKNAKEVTLENYKRTIWGIE